MRSARQRAHCCNRHRMCGREQRPTPRGASQLLQLGGASVNPFNHRVCFGASGISANVSKFTKPRSRPQGRRRGFPALHGLHLAQPAGRAAEGRDCVTLFVGRCHRQRRRQASSGSSGPTECGGGAVPACTTRLRARTARSLSKTWHETDSQASARLRQQPILECAGALPTVGRGIR